MPKAYKAYDEFEDEDIIVFSDSEQRAKEIFYKIITEDDYEGESFEIERVPELDYLNRKNGYVMQSSYKDDWIALLKIGYICKNSEEMADIAGGENYLVIIKYKRKAKIKIMKSVERGCFIPPFFGKIIAWAEMPEPYKGDK